MHLFGLNSLDLIGRRDDIYGTYARARKRLDILSDALVGDLGSVAPAWWRMTADSLDYCGEDHDDPAMQDAAARLRAVAAAIEAADLS